MTGLEKLRQCPPVIWQQEAKQQFEFGTQHLYADNGLTFTNGT